MHGIEDVIFVPRRSGGARPPPGWSPRPGWFTAWVLVLLAAVLIGAAGWPRLSRSRGEVVRCQSNLREIHRLAAGRDPGDKAGAIQALVLHPEQTSLPARLFDCPALPASPLQDEGEGKDFETVPWRIEPSDPPDSIVLFDRGPHHGRTRNVLFLDGSVECIEEREFQELLARQWAAKRRPPVFRRESP